MGDWKTVLGSYSNSGVHSIGKIRRNNAIKNAAILNGLDFTYIDLKEVMDKESFLEAVAHALRFPSHFGMNWDALYDCLTDLSWKPATVGYVIVLANFQSISENMAAEIQIIRNIFDLSVQYWRQKKVSFHIILSE